MKEIKGRKIADSSGNGLYASVLKIPKKYVGGKVIVIEKPLIIFASVITQWSYKPIKVLNHFDEDLTFYERQTFNLPSPFIDGCRIYTVDNKKDIAKILLKHA